MQSYCKKLGKSETKKRTSLVKCKCVCLNTESRCVGLNTVIRCVPPKNIKLPIKISPIFKNIPSQDTFIRVHEETRKKTKSAVLFVKYFDSLNFDVQ